MYLLTLKNKNKSKKKDNADYRQRRLNNTNHKNKDHYRLSAGNATYTKEKLKMLSKLKFPKSFSRKVNPEMAEMDKTPKLTTITRKSNV